VNRLGGLQVLVPNGGSGEWKYVKVISFRNSTGLPSKQPARVQPIPGYAICNIGDTLSILSGGILKSAVHRVVYVKQHL